MGAAFSTLLAYLICLALSFYKGRELMIIDIDKPILLKSLLFVSISIIIAFIFKLLNFKIAYQILTFILLYSLLTLLFNSAALKDFKKGLSIEVSFYNSKHERRRSRKSFM